MRIFAVVNGEDVEKYPLNEWDVQRLSISKQREFRCIEFWQKIDKYLLEKFGFVEVERTDLPEFLKLTEKAVHFPVLQNGKWVQTWEILKLSQKEIDENCCDLDLLNLLERSYYSEKRTKERLQACSDYSYKSVGLFLQS